MPPRAHDRQATREAQWRRECVILRNPGTLLNPASRAFVQNPVSKTQNQEKVAPVASWVCGSVHHPLLRNRPYIAWVIPLPGPTRKTVGFYLCVAVESGSREQNLLAEFATFSFHFRANLNLAVLLRRWLYNTSRACNSGAALHTFELPTYSLQCLSVHTVSVLCPLLVLSRGGDTAVAAPTPTRLLKRAEAAART